ncbi:MAG: DUF308 domain-containing protein [Solobacterium sp.]|nr:DUF308 domain-containing protein [Solobacterium sp.]
MLKELKWSRIITGAAFIAAGVLLCLFPEASSNVICYISGIMMIAYGVLNLILYFTTDIQKVFNRNEFAYGLLWLLGGALIITKRELLFSLVPIFLGLVIVASGFLKLQQAVTALRIQYGQAKYYFILAIVSIILGFAVMFFLSASAAQAVLFRVIGGSLIFCGLSDLVITLFLANGYSRYLATVVVPEEGPTVVDTEAEVVSESVESEEEHV